MPENIPPGNRLVSETSPYLLQHKDNPVHWWAWGEEALAEAERLKRPILLSVGYAACHWCHVMAHESFEDDETAEVMNSLFVNIKVDREERPDVDALYMAALHHLGEHGGWPLTMFLTEKGEPFWGGTYFPKTPKFGRPSFVSVLREVSRVYSEESEKVAHNSNALIESLKPKKPSGETPELVESALAELGTKLTGVVDPRHGGVQGAPKFPQSPLFNFLWRTALRFGNGGSQLAVEKTLTQICQGGIYDHLGGGFARYSVDERWLAPHFEKMLYDNAQLISLMTEVWRETHNPLFSIRIEETAGWLMREMIGEGGGFASSLDADSEGEEGKFYVWSKSEIEDILGAENFDLFGTLYDVRDEGNWEGHTILNRLGSVELRSPEEEERLQVLRSKLMEVRDKRIRPGWDDKILADWNGLMITALVQAASVLERSDWLGAGIRAFDFIVENMIQDGRLIHSYRAGEGKAPATSNDYANMIMAALALAQTGDDGSYLDQAIAWEAVLKTHYWDNDSRGYFLTADDTADLIVRPKSAADEATPNANGIMVSNLMGLYLLTGDEGYRERAEQIFKAFSFDITRNIFSHTSLLSGALDLFVPAHVVIMVSGDKHEAAELKRVLNSVSLPGAVVQILYEGEMLPDGSPANGKTVIDGKPTAYVCIGPQCSAPVTDAAELAEVVKRVRGVEW